MLCWGNGTINIYLKAFFYVQAGEGVAKKCKTKKRKNCFRKLLESSASVISERAAAGRVYPREGMLIASVLVKTFRASPPPPELFSLP